MIDGTQKFAVEYPARIKNLIKRTMGLRPGQYVLLLNVRQDRSISFRVSKMGASEE